ncbi:PKD domain-containing protein [Exilibacterium tricleocarpae]|nr:PKD domain-containing protein [Exilibacterium tricleocarpae]
MSKRILLQVSIFLLFGAMGVSAGAQMLIGGYELVSQERIDRNTFQLEYTAQATNTGSAVSDVSATLATTGQGVTIIDGSLTFGDIAAGVTVTSTDTFVLYVDRRFPLEESDLRWNVTAGRFEAIADCSPLSGPAPLQVRFRSRGEFTGGSIVRYQWDFNGDGIFETSDPVARDYTRIFNSAGRLEAALRVTNNFGDTATDTCTIDVTGNAPVATASVNPSNGSLPLVVQLSCSASDPDGSIVLYEWDFEGDGVFDYSSPTTGTTSNTYTTEGEFEAICRVTDNTGLTATARATTTVIRIGPPGTPQVTAQASPASGFAPLRVNFNGLAVDEGGSIELWEWDFEGDGVFDFSSATSPQTAFTYNQGGIFAAALRVTDNDGLTSIDNVEVIVNLTASLTVLDDTFDPSAGEATTVRTTLSATVPARVLLRDGQGNTAATLFSGERPAGTYDDSWDGTDDQGNPLPQGAYYAILEYDFAGNTVTVDLTDTTGGARYNPSRTRFPRSFTPFNDDLLDVTFTIPSNRGASEVEAFIGLFNVNTRIINLLNRDPLGVGPHTIAWDGFTPEGDFAVAPPGDRFLFGLFAYTLPDNAILLERAPEITALSVEPNFYGASTPDYNAASTAIATLTFDLDKTANIEVQVTNLDTGNLIRDYLVPAVAAGAARNLAWDGKANDGRFAEEGAYRLSVTAVDSTGSRSLKRAALVRVQH